MDSLLTWFIIALFYAPLHYLMPALVVVMRSTEQERRPNLMRALLDCTLSMLLTFAVVIWLVSGERITAAMLVLLLSMALPYIRILGRHPSRSEAPAPDREA
jgi:hypothetical protein